ncbi:beta-galactosidase [Pontiellaceae bacterium B1224]|nr:beta-galactosidase [Pontiellaceae bacterium B1224]
MTIHSGMKGRWVWVLGIAAFACGVFGKTLPMPPKPNPVGEKQPDFGATDGNFTFDGKPAVIISGSIHYPRVPRAYWRDRIRKAKAMGFNCIGTYIFWNAHEKKPGEFDFTGNLDIAAFARVCQEEGMWLIVRPGPYVCSEWDFGGMPPWLLKDPDIQVRTNDPKFLEASARYMKAVGEQLKDLQVTQGGPIIQVQVENEYGQFGRPGNEDDMAYNKAIYDQLVDAGFDCMFIRCDWPKKETVGTAHIDGVYTTMNFGGGADSAFAFFDKEYPGMPKMCGEYWVGWFDHWGSKHHTKALAPFIKQIDWMLENGVSFNVYMLHGGSNFGFNSGANWSSGQYSADTTSYDYDSPMDETGRITEKFFTFRDTIKKFLPADYELPEPPEQIHRIEVPEFELTQMAGFDQLIREPVKSEDAPYMESFDLNQGLALYQTTVDVPAAGEYKLSFSALKDRAIIIVNGKRVATLDRRLKQSSAQIQLPAGKVKLEILLENMGHLNYSRELMTDRKGLGAVELDGKPLLGWEVYSFPLELADIAALKFSTQPVEPSAMPVFYRGEFSIDTIGDTLLDVTGWGKGMIWVNGINLGRYWDIGPQYTLYLPGCWLKEGANEIIVMDIEPTGHHSIKGVTEFIYGLKVDKNLSYNRKPGETLQLSDQQVVAAGSFQNGDDAQLVEFENPIRARYICIEALSSQSDDGHAAIAEIHLIDPQNKLLDRDRWQVIYADSEEIIAEPSSAGNIIDNQPVTFWHTQYQGDGVNAKHPHQVVLDLGGVQEFSSLRYLPRNGPNPGKIKRYKIYASEDLFDGLVPSK